MVIIRKKIWPKYFKFIKSGKKRFELRLADFKAREAQITEIMCDIPGKHTGKHSHMEACIYVLQGEGHSIIDTEKVEWKKGTFLHVQGPQTVHQHFPVGQLESQFLRTHFGIRSHYFQPIAKKVFPYSYYEMSSYA